MSKEEKMINYRALSAMLSYARLMRDKTKKLNIVLNQEKDNLNQKYIKAKEE